MKDEIPKEEKKAWQCRCGAIYFSMESLQKHHKRYPTGEEHDHAVKVD